VSLSRVFTEFANVTAKAAGHPLAFLICCAAVILWAGSGPIFGFSDTWQLVINTGTTIITFLMVFLIQNTQNRDTAAIQLKLDELIRVNQRASNNLLNLESLSDQELDRLKAAFARLADQHPEAREELDDVTEELEDAKEKLEALGVGAVPARAR